MTAQRLQATAMAGEVPGLPRVHETVVHMLHDAACLAPSAEALVCRNERLTYADYWHSVTTFADELAHRGAGGERVALLSGNATDTAIAFYAIQAAGAQLVPLNPAYTAHELRFILADAAPRIIVHEAALSPLVLGLVDDVGRPDCIAVGTDNRLARVGRPDAPRQPALPLPDPEAPALLQYTGGTTGRPKGVSLTHHAIAINVAQREALLPTVPEVDRVLAITPLFHAYASAMGLFLAVYARGALVILPRYRPECVFEAVRREQITLFAGSPTIFNGLLAHEGFRRADLSSLRLCYSGSAALPAETLRRWEAETGCTICEGYGQTEAGPVLTYNPQNGLRKAGSVGVPLPATEIEIVDVETGTRVLQPGEIGEVRARGPQVMLGYRNRADETAAALRGGWLYTGDLGEVDTDGYLFIRDRKKEMVIVAGYNVYPREVEEVLYAHPSVAEAAVVGRPDAYRGEALVAFVVRKRGDRCSSDELAGYLGERLVRYKVPSEIRFVDAVPRTGVGKIDKTMLRQRAGV